MVSREIEITFKIGIHGRPAVLLVQKAKEFTPVQITISKNGKEIDAKSLMGLLSLGITQGSKIKITVSGENEEKILETIIDLIENKLPKEAPK